MQFLRLVAAAYGVASSQAVVAFSNFGAGDSYTIGTGWSLLSGVHGTQAVSHQFVSGASGSLESIEVAIGHVAGTNDYSISLRSDNIDTPDSYITTGSGVGTGAFGDGAPSIADSGAFRVNVVPEPASMAALGLGAVALIRRRKSR